MNDMVLEAMPKEVLAQMWHSYDWEKAESFLFALQRELVIAAYAEDTNKIVELQKKIVRSMEAKMLAVRKVCGMGDNTGIDGIKWRTEDERFYAAMKLTSKNYQATPYRHIIIETKSGKERHINIPTYYDKAMQVLYGFSLSPLAEASGERKSFAFRAGRSMLDANEYIKEALTQIGSGGYVVLSDVKACYQSISHKWLLDNIPMDKKVLKEFLTAGYVFNGEIYPTEDYGISIGFSISPTIANMTLDGMQKYIYERLYSNADIDYPNGNLIRFADDVLITVKSIEEAHKVIKIISDFLYVRGLKLSDEKTKIVSCYDGFDFLSRHYSMRNGMVYVCPSEKAITRFENDLQDLIMNFAGSQKSLIEKINKKLTGWATYHRTSEAEMAFRRLDVFVKATLMKKCQVMHPTWTRNKIIEKYWYKEYDGDYIYALKDRVDIRVKKLADTLLVGHKKIKTNANIYSDEKYIEQRTDRREIITITGKYRSIWNRQHGKCYYCGHKILLDQPKEIIQKDLSMGKNVSNLVYIHSKCKSIPLEYIHTDIEPASQNDIIGLIESLDKSESKRGNKFLPLSNYFRQRTELSISLTFKEIEDILGASLCKTARTSRQYWCKTDSASISQTWLPNGYTLQRVRLDEQKVLFHKTEKNTAPVNIPEVFLNGRVPLDAKYEVENFLDVIKKKYAL